MKPQPGAEEVVAATRTWLERAVIGLNLCPFAKTVHLSNRIRYFVSAARSPMQLLEDLMAELRALDAADPAHCETTLLIHPHVLADFPDYNEFLEQADDAVSELGLEGLIQVASFHPRYRFEDAGPDDIENYTNRSPYPMLHLLRESSVERAVTTYPDTTAIYRKNIETLRRLGHEGWRRLWLAEAPQKAPARPGRGSTPIKAFTAEDAERCTDTLPTKSADCGECTEAPPSAPDGNANAVSAAPEEKREE